MAWFASRLLLKGSQHLPAGLQLVQIWLLEVVVDLGGCWQLRQPNSQFSFDFCIVHVPLAPGGAGEVPRPGGAGAAAVGAEAAGGGPVCQPAQGAAAQFPARPFFNSPPYACDSAARGFVVRPLPGGLAGPALGWASNEPIAGWDRGALPEEGRRGQASPWKRRKSSAKP